MHLSSKQRRAGVNIAAQLPEDTQAALGILAAARELVLFAERMEVPTRRLRALEPEQEAG